MSGSQVGDLGSGAGKGGGGGGSIREAGGAFGKLEAAREEEYFYKKVSELQFNLNFKWIKIFTIYLNSIRGYMRNLENPLINIEQSNN